MDNLSILLLRSSGVIILLGLCLFGVISLRERENRAARVAFLSAGGLGGLFFGLSAIPQPVPMIVFWFLIAAIVSLFILFISPIGNTDSGNDEPRTRYDEREIMFARDRLQPGTQQYDDYYAMHPDHEHEDWKTRGKPGLSSPQSKFSHPFQFASMDGSFFLTESLRDAVDGPVSEDVQEMDVEKMTRYVKDLATYFGAKEVGVTQLKPYHVYSHVGRGSGTYGEPIALEYRFAVAFTVEMDFEMVGTSPYPPTTMETGKQYGESASVAVQLAATIRELGYPARAHIDGNYRVIAPLVARDAGLGEIGRMTILMTPRQGPRVRLGVVTTDLELIPDSRGDDQSVIDFCTICEKCARICPSRSIPFGQRNEIDGAFRWKLNPDTCFRYWKVAGTDCARCMSVCPFSHPDTFSHNLIRWGIRNSGFFRRAALWLDDLFYGKEPGSRHGPKWLDVG